MALLDFPHPCRGQLHPETADVNTGAKLPGTSFELGLIGR
jgi:hypothetical protein